MFDKTSAHLRSASDAVALLTRLAEADVVNHSNQNSLEDSFYSFMSINSQISGIFIGKPNGDFLMASRYNDRNSSGYFTKDIRNREGGLRSVEYRYYDSEGILTAREDIPEDEYDPRTRPWYSSGISSQNAQWTRPYMFFTSGQPGITTSLAVRDGSGAVIAVLGVDLTLGDLSDFVAQTRISENGAAFILDEDDRFLALSDRDRLDGISGDVDAGLLSVLDIDDPIYRTALSQFDSVAADGFSGGSLPFVFEHAGQVYHALFRTLENPNWLWKIGLFIPQDDIMGDLIANRRLILLFTGSAGLIFAVIGFFFARALTRPLVEIQESLKVIEHGGYPSVFPGRFVSREIESIVQRIKDMSDSLRQYHGELEDRVDQRTEELKQANEAKSRFLAKVSHEMRSPLQAIMGYAEILGGNKIPRSRQLASLEIIRDEGERLLTFIDELLDIHRISQGHFQLDTRPFDLSEILEAVNSRFTPLARKKGLSFSIRFDESIEPIRNGDGFRLEQILSNLTANALKFTEKGSVVIEISKREQGLYFSVSDSGPGIPEEKRELIFKPFEKLPSDHGGLTEGFGLGLNITRELIELFGGQLSLDSAPGTGSRFYFTLPLHPADPELVRHRVSSRAALPLSAGENPQQKNNGAQQQYRILLVDDYPVNQDLLSQYLKNLAKDLVICSSGEDAIKKGRKRKFDAILMDIILPGIDGIEAAKAIRAEGANRRTAIVAISASDDGELRSRIASPTEDRDIPIFTEILVKPFSRKALEDCIRRVTASPPGKRPIAMNQIIEQLSGDNRQAIELLEQFLEQSDRLLLQLQTHLQQKDWKESHRLVHSLKNGAEALFAAPLAQQAKAFELRLKDLMTEDDRDDSEDTSKETHDDRRLILDLLQSLMVSFDEVQSYCEQNILQDSMADEA